MHKQFVLSLVALGAATLSAAQTDPLTALSDEFAEASSLAAWQRHEVAENWISQWKVLDINTTSPGHLYLEPHSSFWWSDYRAPYLFKRVKGDFVATIRVKASGRTSETPRRQYSLVGLMARAARSDTPQTWQTGKENWVFLTTGTAEPAGVPHFEVKTTVNGRSTLRISPAPTGWVEIRIARVGAAFIMMQRPDGGSWNIHQRYARPDLPEELQVGVNAYTDWDTFSERVGRGQLGALEYNSRVYLDGQPDLLARVDWARFKTPQVPLALQSKNLISSEVSNAQLLEFLGIDEFSGLCCHRVA